jgi:4-amino-4-deoxy-L-arabinose transferase-like glycosyltransferase
MWDAGSWLVPLFNGAPYSHKTPLLPWLIHAGWLVGGVNDVWPRLLMVLLGAVIVAQTGWLARRLYPHKPDLPKLAAWAMAGFWYFFMFSLQVMYELPLTVAVLGGLLALCRRSYSARYRSTYSSHVGSFGRWACWSSVRRRATAASRSRRVRNRPTHSNCCLPSWSRPR